MFEGDTITLLFGSISIAVAIGFLGERLFKKTGIPDVIPIMICTYFLLVSVLFLLYTTRIQYRQVIISSLLANYVICLIFWKMIPNMIL